MPACKHLHAHTKCTHAYTHAYTLNLKRTATYTFTSHSHDRDDLSSSMLSANVSVWVQLKLTPSFYLQHMHTQNKTHILHKSPFLILSRKNGTAREPLTAQRADSQAKAVDERKIVLMQQGSCSFPIKPIKHMLPSFL